MRKLLVALVPVLLSTAALAAPPTTGMTCRQAQEIVGRHGSAVLYTGQFTYDRYVADRRFCEINQATRPAWVPTRDTAQCYVGNTCYDPDSDRDQWLWR